MKGKTEILDLFSEHGIKPTANRLLVCTALSNAEGPMSLLDLETEIGSMDRSSIFRCLVLFREKHLVHCIETGDEGAKYELCKGWVEGEDTDEHVHFHCQVCHKTYCLEEIHIPQVALPEGFEADDSNFVISGTCPDCRM